MTNTEKIELALADLKSCKPIIILDDKKREHEGDLFIPAAFATEENINFIIQNAKGLMCAPLSKKIAKKLSLVPMIENPTDRLYTPFTFSVDDINTKTGISSKERYMTIKTLANENATIDNFSIPGHMFPLIAQDGGIKTRPGHSEAAVDLCKLCGVYEVGVIMEILNENGSMARTNDLEILAKKWDLQLITIHEIELYLNK